MTIPPAAFADESPAQPTYPLPGLRVAVAYAATDGTMPESIELEWRDAPDPRAIDGLLSTLGRLPVDRHVQYRLQGTLSDDDLPKWERDLLDKEYAERNGGQP